MQLDPIKVGLIDVPHVETHFHQGDSLLITFKIIARDGERILGIQHPRKSLPNRNVISDLGRIGDADSITALKEILEDQEWGKFAVSAVRAISSKQ